MSFFPFSATASTTFSRPDGDGVEAASAASEELGIKKRGAKAQMGACEGAGGAAQRKGRAPRCACCGETYRELREHVQSATHRENLRRGFEALQLPVAVVEKLLAA